VEEERRRERNSESWIRARFSIRGRVFYVWITIRPFDRGKEKTLTDCCGFDTREHLAEGRSCPSTGSLQVVQGTGGRQGESKKMQSLSVEVKMTFLALRYSSSVW